MLDVPRTGNALFVEFVNDRLKSARKGYFEPTKRVKFTNGFEKKKKTLAIYCKKTARHSV